MRVTRYLILAVLMALNVPMTVAQGESPPLTKVPFVEGAISMQDGSTTTYADLKGEKGTLFIVWEASCAWAKRHQERVAALQPVLEAAGINVYLMHTRANPALQLRLPETDEADPLAWIPGIDDNDGTLTKQLQATRIPQFFLFDAADAIAYGGALDDSPGNPDQVQDAYLKVAIEALGAGTAVVTNQTRPFGCMIR